MHGKSGEPTVRCPFHEDRRPSLRINIQKQVWRCDPCGIGGDVFAFVRQFNKCSFLEALSFLAGCLLVFVAFRGRTRRLQAQARKLEALVERHARDLHAAKEQDFSASFMPEAEWVGSPDTALPFRR